MIIKQLQHLGLNISPITISESVLVKTERGIERLDKVLPRKIETIESNDLQVTRKGTGVVIIHKNAIDPINTPTNVKIGFDQHGHITLVTQVAPLKVTLMGQDYKSYTGDKEETLNLGDDFESINDSLRIRWNNIKKT